MQSKYALARFLVVLFVCGMSPIPTSAQGTSENPAWNVPGKWRPWHMEDQSPDLAKCATRSEWAVLEANLKKIRGLWEQIPAIASPIGYEISAIGHYPVVTCLRVVYLKEHKREERPYVQIFDKTPPLTGEVSFYPFNYVTIRPKLEAADETLGIHFNVNMIPTFSADELLEPVRVADRFGAPAYEVTEDCFFNDKCGSDSVLVIRNNDAPLWKPVPLVEIYDRLLDEAQFAIVGFEREAERARQNFEESLTPKSRNMREELCRQISISSGQKKKSPADYFAGCLEEDRKDKERRRKEIADAGPRPGTRWGEFKERVDLITELRNKLLADNPGAFAYTCRPIDYHNNNGFVKQYKPAPGPKCRAIVRANKDYFNPKLPRTAIQLITVTHYEECLKVPASAFVAPGQCKAVLKLLENIDWSKVRNLMDK
jgi:hypothetical protein